MEESPGNVVNKEFVAEEVTRETEGRRVTRAIKVLEMTKEKEETHWPCPHVHSHQSQYPNSTPECDPTPTQVPQTTHVEH